VARARFARRAGDPEETLSAQPDYALVGVLRIPETRVSPAVAISRRVAVALCALLATVITVYLDRGGYYDVHRARLSLVDCIYYATVSLSTTGYGDITPYTESARLLNVLLITPLRVLFLIILVGTTLEVLTERSRQAFKIGRWRNRVRNHTIVIGYGTKGRSAVDAMLGDGVSADQIVVVDTNQAALDRAAAAGVVTVLGNATRSDVLRLAGAEHAASIVVATNRDDTAVLVTLTAREIAPKARIVASVREGENRHLLRQSGADSVVVSAETAGRLLGLATVTPTVVKIMEDLLAPEAGFVIAEREVEPKEVGESPRQLADIVVAVVRNGELLPVDAADVGAIMAGDRLLYIRGRGGAAVPPSRE
jgi:voltage-gated potassium channel